MNLAPLAIQKFFDNRGNPLNGGLLFTYVAGTTTKLATYTDSSGGTPNTNPVVLNFRGEANVWLDQTLTYKFVLSPSNDTDPPTNPIWSVDNISAGVTFASLTQQIIGQILWKRTPAEITAGVTPTNYFYPPLNVLRYGAVGDLTTNDAPAFQRAIDVAKAGGGTVWIPAAGSAYLGAPATGYLLTSALDCTYNSNGNVPGWGIAGDPNGINSGLPTVIIKHTGHGFDFTGNPTPFMRDIVVGTDSSTYPDIGVLLARNSTNSSQMARFINVKFFGKFSKSAHYNYGSEEDVYLACVFYNFATDAACKCMVFTANNVQSITSTFVTIATGTRPTTAHSIYGGEILANAGGATTDLVYLESVASLTIDGVFMFNQGATRPRALIYVDTTNGPTNNVTLKGIQSEYSAAAGHLSSSYGIFIGTTAATPSRWSIVGCDLSSETSRIASSAGVILDDFYLFSTGVSGGTANISILGTLQNSTWVENATNITIGTSSANNLFIPPGSLTITTRSGDNWLGPDASLTWTPGTGALTHGGTLTVSLKTVHYHGRQVTVTCSLKDSISMSWAANTAITGLPATCVMGRGQVTVVNSDTAAQVGIGYVNGTSIFLPALAAAGTNEIAITATYFVST